MAGITNYVLQSSHKTCVICIIHYFDHKIFIEHLVCDKTILGFVHPALNKIKSRPLDSGKTENKLLCTTSNGDSQVLQRNLKHLRL